MIKKPVCARWNPKENGVRVTNIGDGNFVYYQGHHSSLDRREFIRRLTAIAGAGASSFWDVVMAASISPLPALLEKPSHKPFAHPLAAQPPSTSPTPTPTPTPTPGADVIQTSPLQD